MELSDDLGSAAGTYLRVAVVEDGLSYGGKTANLALLLPLLPDEERVRAFGIPLAYILARYRQVGKTVFTALTIHHGIIPPTINFDNPGEECDLDYVPNVARDAKVRLALSNSFGFGGTNGSLVFGAFD